MATKEELEQQLKVARNDIETLAAMAGQTAREQLSSGAETAQNELMKLSDDTRALFDSARAEGAKLRGATEDQIRANPLATVGIAFVAGIVVSSLLGRR